MAKRRLDQLLVERGLAPTRERACALLMAGRVRSRGRLYTKAGQAIAIDTPLEIAPTRQFVSRGGHKLRAALNTWPIDVTGAVCLDIGASSGGFTDCLLQAGAASVYAVDVGYGQLDPSLRADPRVRVMERTNARSLPQLEDSPGMVVMDVSFISLRAILPSVATRSDPSADVIALVKPQFEAERDQVGRGGVVRDPGARASAVAQVIQWTLMRRWRVGGVLPSPLTGPAGNREFFIWLRTPPARKQSSS